MGAQTRSRKASSFTTSARVLENTRSGGANASHGGPGVVERAKATERVGQLPAHIREQGLRPHALAELATEVPFDPGVHLAPDLAGPGEFPLMGLLRADPRGERGDVGGPGSSSAHARHIGQEVGRGLHHQLALGPGGGGQQPPFDDAALLNERSPSPY